MNAQIGINTTHPKASLDIESTDSGLLIPRVSLQSNTDTSTVSNSQGGLIALGTLVYNINTVSAGNSSIGQGFQVWNGVRWELISDGAWYKSNSSRRSTFINDNVYTLGNVSIANTDDSLYALDINGDFHVDSARNLLLADGGLSANGGLRFYYVNRAIIDNKSTRVFLRTSDPSGTGTEIVSTTIFTDSSYVGIGDGFVDDRLHVIQGSVQIDTDNMLMFGGDGENSDPINFKRISNTSTGASRLELTIGDNPSSMYDDFVISVRNLFVSPVTRDDRFKFESSGVASKLNSGSWATLSDRRVKENITNFEDGLEKIKAINPINFQYNYKGASDKVFTGVIAQELEKVAPYTVSIQQDSTIENLRIVDDSALQFVLVNSLQELNKKQLILKERIAQIEERLLALDK